MDHLYFDGAITIVYTFAGIAKLQSDWLLRAMPLAVWLPEHKDLPLLGYFFQFQETAYLFSWFGAFYDLTIAYFLMYRPTRPMAYLAVLVFHIITKLLFNIGLFPIIMIGMTLIFFSADFHKRLLVLIGYQPNSKIYAYPKRKMQILQPFFVLFIIIQILLPLHHHVYHNNVLWTEEGYRWSWRVMVVEKNGIATFRVLDSKTGRKTEITNSKYLTKFQEKQMAIQPDFIIQYAHFLAKEFETKYGFQSPIVTADVHVALNGRTSQRFIDPEMNLAKVIYSFKTKGWVLDFKNQ